MMKRIMDEEGKYLWKDIEEKVAVEVKEIPKEEESDIEKAIMEVEEPKSIKKSKKSKKKK